MRAKRRNLNKDREITRIIGLMSGTSHDGVDAALIEIRSDEINFKLIKHIHIPYPRSLRNEIRMSFTGNTELICRLNFRLGEVFAKTVLSILEATGLKPEDIDAVSSHGQTICHIPPSSLNTGKGIRKSGSTLQIGEASVIAERTGILTISDFRTADMAAGGHGAPLVPLSDYLLFRQPRKIRAIVNIGGIANMTVVKENIDDTIAFDIGPGNSLIDEAMRVCSRGKKSYDMNGDFARSGKLVKRLLNELLGHSYFRKSPPKSISREVFGADMVHNIFRRYRKTAPQDIVSTFTRLTAAASYNAIIKFKPDEVILTGGGVHNRFLTGLMTDLFENDNIKVSDISSYGIPPQAKEAISFAILGYQSLNRKAGNIPSVTGARHKVILGKITWANFL